MVKLHQLLAEFHDLCKAHITLQGGFVSAAHVLNSSRQRYQSLLDRIPRRLKALHTETVAQRALDRRLTEEIHRIKSSIQQLSTYVGRRVTCSWTDFVLRENSKCKICKLKHAVEMCDSQTGLCVFSSQGTVQNQKPRCLCFPAGGVRSPTAD